jgi:hypothetical protein
MDALGVFDRRGGDSGLSCTGIAAVLPKSPHHERDTVMTVVAVTALTVA